MDVHAGSLRGAIFGAIQAVTMFGIGQTFGAAGAMESVAAHSIAGGILSKLQGGDFGHGFISAGLSKVAGFGTSRALSESGPGVKIMAQAMIGGTISELTGGKFANGAISSAMQYAFNEVLNSAVSVKRELLHRRLNSIKSMIEAEFPELTEWLPVSEKAVWSQKNIAEHHGDGVRFKKDFWNGATDYSDYELIETYAHEALHGLVNKYFGSVWLYGTFDFGTWAIVPNDSRFGGGIGVYHAWIHDSGRAIRDHLLYNDPRPDLSFEAMIEYRKSAGWNKEYGQ